MPALRLALVGSVLVALGMPTQASATTYFPEKFTCPVGGEKFEDYVVGSSTSWGQRPDGRSYGTLPLPPIVECPGNGFPLFRETFTKAEIARLTPLVESAEFLRMRTSDTPHYRAWWLMRALGEKPATLATTLLVASWESDDDPARKARYQREFVAAAHALPPAESPAGFYLNLRAANALRELGSFAEAENVLSLVTGGMWPTEPDEREGADFLISGLRVLIAERNAASEPTNLIPADMAIDRCAKQTAQLSASEQVACSSPDHRTAAIDRAEQEQDAEHEKDWVIEEVHTEAFAEAVAVGPKASAISKAERAVIEAAADAAAAEADAAAAIRLED